MPVHLPSREKSDSSRRRLCPDGSVSILCLDLAKAFMGRGPHQGVCGPLNGLPEGPTSWALTLPRVLATGPICMALPTRDPGRSLRPKGRCPKRAVSSVAGGGPQTRSSAGGQVDLPFSTGGGGGLKRGEACWVGLVEPVRDGNLGRDVCFPGPDPSLGCPRGW